MYSLDVCICVVCLVFHQHSLIDAVEDLRLLARRVDEEVNKDGQMEATEEALKHIRECFKQAASDRFCKALTDHLPPTM